MNVLGYIVSNRKIKGLNGFVEQVNDIDLADSSKPILIVGWENAKKHPKYSSILDKQLDDNLFWTFSRNESRSDFEEDLENFYNIIYNNILNNIKYYYVNIFKLRYNKIKKLYNILNSNKLKNIYISSDGMLYIPFEENILGLSLNILEYCGISRDKILSRIGSNPSNKIIDDGSKSIFKLSKRLGNKRYALPYFISS